MRILTCTLVLGTLMACRTGGATVEESDRSTATTTTDTAVFFRLQRTPCFGTCPDYVVTIRRNGEAAYEGGAHALRQGRYQGRFTADQRKALLARAEALGFFGLADRYDADVTDLPSTIITLDADGRRKEVLGRVGAPPAFQQLGQYADSLLDRVEWTPVPR